VQESTKIEVEFLTNELLNKTKKLSATVTSKGKISYPSIPVLSFWIRGTTRNELYCKLKLENPHI
jgi:hypothetical protein